MPQVPRSPSQRLHGRIGRCTQVLRASTLIVACLLSSACGTPQIDVHATPKETLEVLETVNADLSLERSLVPRQTEIFIDGQRRGQGSATATIPYYGAVGVRAVALGQNESGARLGERRALLSVEPPLSRWLFGIDFFYEMLSSSWLEAPKYEIELILPELASPLPAGTAPPRTEALRLRNQQMALRR